MSAMHIRRNVCEMSEKSFKYNATTNDDYYGFLHCMMEIVARFAREGWLSREWSENFHVFPETKMNKIFLHIFVLLNLIFWRIARSDMQSFSLPLTRFSAIFACFIKQFLHTMEHGGVDVGGEGKSRKFPNGSHDTSKHVYFAIFSPSTTQTAPKHTRFDIIPIECFAANGSAAHDNYWVNKWPCSSYSHEERPLE